MTKILNSVRISEENEKIFETDAKSSEPDKTFAAQLKTFLLNCDNERADLDPYDENILFDPNRGHWDLWDFDRDGGRLSRLTLARAAPSLFTRMTIHKFCRYVWAMALIATG